MKNRIKKAQDLHKKLHGEIITGIAIGAVLYPESALSTQANMMSSLRNGKTKLSTDHIRKLVALFPDTDADYWIGMIDFKQLRSDFIGKYSIDVVTIDLEIQALYEMLCNYEYCKKLYKKYL